MAISTVNVDFSAILQDAAQATGLLRVRLSQVGTVEDSETGDTVILPIAWQETTLTDGAATLALVPNKIIEPSCTYYEIQLKSVPDCPKACAKLLLSGIMYVPDEDCNVLDLLISPPSPETANTASGYASQAKQAAQVAENFAIQAGDRYDDVAEAAATALTDIGTAKQDALDAIGTAQSEATEAISTAQGTATAAVQAEGNTQVGRVEDAGEDAVADVTAAQATAVSAVQAQQATSIAAVTAEGTRQTGLVTAEGTAQVNAVTQAGNGYVATMQGLVSDAQAAQDAAQTAQGLAEDAQEAAESASTEAQGYAGDASTSAGQAAQSASNAAASATAAQASADSMAASAEQIQTNERNITNIQALLNGTLYREEVDSTAAYSKAVPTGALPYASINEIGGKTVVWNQLIAPLSEWGVNTAYGAGEVNADGSITYTLTVASNNAVFTSSSANMSKMIAGHKYVIFVDIDSSATKCTFRQSGGNPANQISVDKTTGRQVCKTIFTATNSSADGNAYIYPFPTGYSPSVGDSARLYSVNIHDLTLMFGAGNEPATVAEFQSMFPTIDPAYNAGELMSAGVTEVVSKDANDATLGTLPIPSAIQSLPGYGWSAGTAYNGFEYGTKKYTQAVGRQNLSDLSWVLQSINSNGLANFLAYLTIDMKRTYAAISASICNRFVYTPVTIADATEEGMFPQTNTAIYIRIKSSTASTVPEFEQWLSDNPTYFQIELATPIETDISQYLSDDNLINVEAGGTLTFKNQHSDDWQVPVPNEETFLVQATPELPTTDGTYTLQCTVTDGTPSVTWVTA